MISLKPMSVGDGYKYLTGHVARGDVDQPAHEGGRNPLTRYYTSSGYPAGVWAGSGLDGLDGGEVRPGVAVEEWRMAALFAEGRDPTSGRPLGRLPNGYASLTERIDERIAALPGSLSGAERDAAIAQIRDTETRRPTRTAKGGFDLTFTAPKSVSALWAIADETTRATILDAHHDTLTDMIDYLEREVIFTRVGHGGVAQVDTRGIIAAAFDHWDSRGGDPNLHTHLAVANRVQTAEGTWLTIDSRGLHHAIVAVSELYDATLADRLTRRLGVDWEPRQRPLRRTIAREIGGVPEALITEFSSRSDAIAATLETLVAEFVDTHGRQPGEAEHIRLRQAATLADRPVKRQPRPLPELVDHWRARAVGATGRRAEAIVADTLGQSRSGPLHAEQVPNGQIDAWAEMTVAAVQTRRSTWNRWNLMTEAIRLTAGLRFASPADRETFTARITDAAQNRSVDLHPDPERPGVDRFHRRNGEDVFSRHGGTRYSSDAVLGAEQYLVGLAATPGPTAAVDAPMLQSLSDDQHHAVVRLAGSGHRLDVLVGPAGTGKTTTLSALRDQWTRAHGEDSVIGLAPSAAAADVLAGSLGVPCENTVKWLHESVGPGSTSRRDALARVARARQRARSPGTIGRLDSTRSTIEATQQRWQFRANQLVIIDEASLAGTLALATIARQAEGAGAKVVLVGDHAQLSAVEAGGALRMLAGSPDVVELSNVWRFHNDWERTASLALRAGETEVIDTYDRHRRIREGTHPTMLDDAYTAWHTDTRSGRTSLLIAGDNATVRDLNRRARADLVATGEVEQNGTDLHDGTCAGVGDRIVTRRNNRALEGPSGWVHNGDIFRVIGRGDDGSLAVRRDTPDADPQEVLSLPADYVARHVALGYATTAHRAQGMTVDSSHTIVTAGLTREVLYVAATRGQEANHLYAALDSPGDDPDDLRHIVRPNNGREVLEAVLSHSGAEQAAADVARASRATERSMSTLIPIYEHIAQQLSELIWSPVLEHVRTDAGGSIVTSESWPRLAALLRTVTLAGADTHQLIRDVASDDITGHADPAAVLLGRISSAFTTSARTQPVDYLAGLVVPAEPSADPALQAAIDHAAQAIAGRAAELADEQIRSNAPWLAALGPRPDDPERIANWRKAVETVATYRDRWNVTDPEPLGAGPGADRTRQRDHRRASQAITAVRGPTATQPPAHMEDDGMVRRPETSPLIR